MTLPEILAKLPEMKERCEKARIAANPFVLDLSIIIDDCMSVIEQEIPVMLEKTRDEATKVERKTLKTVIEILLGEKLGAAMNAVREDYPEFVELIEQARREAFEEAKIATCAFCESGAPSVEAGGVFQHKLVGDFFQKVAAGRTRNRLGLHYGNLRRLPKSALSFYLTNGSVLFLATYTTRYARVLPRRSSHLSRTYHRQ